MTKKIIMSNPLFGSGFDSDGFDLGLPTPEAPITRADLSQIAHDIGATASQKPYADSTPFNPTQVNPTQADLGWTRNETATTETPKPSWVRRPTMPVNEAMLEYMADGTRHTGALMPRGPGQGAQIRKDAFAPVYDPRVSAAERMARMDRIQRQIDAHNNHV